MKKNYLLMCFGLLLVMAVSAQTSSKEIISLQKKTLQLSSKENAIESRVIQPLPLNNPLFNFDSLHVSYLGSWGFGQSFSIGSNDAGTIKFIGSGAGVIILDVTNPSNPVKLSEISTRGLVDALYFDESNSRLYVTAYFAGFEIWDLSNMSLPHKIGGGPINGLPRGGIHADGNYVYVVSVADGVQIFDVTTPSSPINVGNCVLDPNNFAWNSVKSGNHIFAALSDGGMKVVDVSDPQNPFVAGTFADVVYGVEVSNGVVYVVSYAYGLNILDISDLSNITVTGTCSITGFPNRVQVQGNYAYVGNTDSGAGGINVIDISNPANPTLVTTYPGYAAYITARGNSLAFTGSSMVCTIIDISTPTTPVLANSYSIPNFTGDIYVDGNYAYTGNNGFRVFDITDKTHPVQVGYNIIDGSIVRTSGNKAVYIRESMSANNPVMLMDISDPTNPTLLGQYNSPVMTNDLEVRDHYAFVSCWWDGVRIVDLQDPANPVLTAHSMGWTNGGTPGVTFFYAQALDVEGNYLYVLDYGPFAEEDTKGLYILDISDINNPTLVTRFTGLSSYGYDLDVVGNFVYIADNYGGVEVIDVTDKNNPVTRGYAALPDGANFVKVTENMAFVADYINGGVQVVDVSDPDNPIVAGYYLRSGCFALGVDVSGTNIFLADGAGGFQIYNTDLITRTSNYSKSTTSAVSWPNPFSNYLKIKIDAGVPSGDYLIIYDAAGNKITSLLPVENHHNQTVYEWDGKSSSGNNACPGFYYYKSATGNVCGKMIKVK